MKRNDLKRKLRRRTIQRATGSTDLVATHREPPSSRWLPMRRMPEFDAMHTEHQRLSEWWENWRYYANVTRFESGFFVGDGPYAIVGISSIDETARHDWRDFQRIKNDVCGEDWEGIELYPSEVRLVDPSNRFYLWCVPPGVLRFGFRHGRRVLDLCDAVAPQRPFPKENQHERDRQTHPGS